MKYYRITFNDKIAKIKGNAIRSGNDGCCGRCSYAVQSVSLPGTIKDASEESFYECENIKSVVIGGRPFNRKDGEYRIPSVVDGKGVIFKIKETDEQGCSIFTFRLPTPLCKDDSE